MTGICCFPKHLYLLWAGEAILLLPLYSQKEMKMKNKTKNSNEFIKEVIDYFKGKNIQDADKLLFETAQNNFKLGYNRALQEFKELAKEICLHKKKQKLG